MKVSGPMTADVVVIDGQMTLIEAAKMMQEKDIHHLPVVENEELLGLLSEREIQAAFQTSDGDLAYGLKTSQLAKDHLTQAITVNDDADLLEVVEKLVQAGAGAAIVISKDKIAGIITETDTLCVLVKALKEMDQEKREELDRFATKLGIGRVLDMISHAGI